MPSLDKYSTNQLKEIQLLFSDNSYYADLFNSCYSGASKKAEKEAENIQKQILSIVQQALESGQRSIELPELSGLLRLYRTSASTTTNLSNDQKKKDQNAKAPTKLLLEIIDNFSNQFKFESPNHFASVLVIHAKPEDQKHFNDLQIWRALSRKKIASLENKEYIYTRTEEELLRKQFGIKKNEDLKDLDQKFNLEEIYKKLDNAYKKVCEVPFVKTTFKTNYLKSAGIHGKNILIGLSVALGVGAVFSFTPIAGAPMVNPSMEAIINFWVGQMLPIAGIGLASGTAASSLSAIVDNRTTQRLRDQIRKLDPNQKEILFQLVQKYTPTKENKLTSKQAFKRFNQELLSNGIKLKWGARKTAKFNHLVDSEKDISSKLLKVSPGATKRQQRQKDKYDEKVFDVHNLEIKSLADSRLSKLLSPKNPACEHIEIVGTKSRTSAASKTKDQAQAEAIPTLNYSQQEAYAREEKIPTAISNPEAIEDLKSSLRKPSIRTKTIKFKYKEDEAAYLVTIKKAEAKSYLASFKKIMEDLQEYVDSKDDNPVELTYEEGVNIGKNKKRSMDVTITPQRKDK